MIIDLVIMQPIDLCNLNCTYCYLPGRRDPKAMDDNVLDASFKCIFNGEMVNPVFAREKLSIVWHAGEPLIVGINFYKKALTVLDKYNTNKIDVAFEIQSNATLIDQEWCDFFKSEPKINLTISLDGPEFLHNRMRKDWKGKGSFASVMKGVKILDKNNIPLKAICVLTRESLNHPEDIYNFFKENNFKTLCFNVEEQEAAGYQSSMSSRVEGEFATLVGNFKEFMSKIYDLWKADGRSIHIREIDRTVKSIKNARDYGIESIIPSSETLPFRIITITKNGDVSTFSPELSGGIADDRHKFHIGNVLAIETIDQLTKSEKFTRQMQKVFSGVSKCAQQCKYYSLCGGGSPSNKFYENGSFDTTETFFCRLSYQALSDVILDKLAS